MKKSYSDIPIIDRFSKIIDLVAMDANGKKATDLLNEMEVPKTTLYRILASLVINGFLLKDENTKKYYLGTKFSDFSTMLDHKYKILKEVSRPYLEKLAAEIGETTKISVLSNLSCYVLDKVESKEKIRIIVDTGTVFPLYAGASSKLLLSSLNMSTIENIFEQEVEKYTVNTIDNIEDMKEELKKIKVQGYSTDEEEYIEGIGAIACGVLDKTGRIVATVSIAYPIAKMTSERLNVFISEIQKTANEITQDFICKMPNTF